MNASSYKIIVTLTLLTLLSTRLPAPTGVGSGGDIVHCAGDPTHELEGYYVLDYMLSPSIFKYATGGWEKVLAQVKSLFYYQAPHIYDAYKIFDDDFLQNRVGDEYRWIPSENLTHISDESLDGVEESRLQYCRRSDGQVDEYQAVIRHAVDNGVQFMYDPKLVQEIKDQRDNSQLGFLALHEFFWRYTTSAHQIRQAIRWIYASYDADSLQGGIINFAGMVLDGYPGSTRSLRLYSVNGVVPKEQGIGFDVDAPNHQYRLIVYNSLSVAMTIYRDTTLLATLLPDASQAIEFRGPFPLGKGIVLVAQSEDGRVRSEMRLDDAHWPSQPLH